MKIRVGHLCTVTLLSLLSLFGLAAQAIGQGYIFNQMSYFQLLNAPANTFAIAQGDFNGDGQMDFAMASVDTVNSSNLYYIGIYLAQSNGTYAMTSSYGIPGDGPYSNGGNFAITVGDVNGDGKLDLIYTGIFNPPGDPNWIVVQLGNGDGTFQIPIATVTPSTGYPLQSLILGDFNGDGKLDLSFVDQTNNVWVQLGNGDGTFQTGVSYPVGGLANQLVTADFNKDGKLDLAVACPFSGGQIGTYVLLGNGDGSFGAATYYTAGGSGIAAADMNDDGKPDLVVSGEPSSDVSVLLGNGDGTFQTPISTPVAGNIGTIVAADFNGDGKIDVAMMGGWTGIVILLGNDNGTFKSPLNTYGSGSLGGPSSLLVGDYNLDGKPDLASVSYQGVHGAVFSILTNDGDGTFGSGEQLAAGYRPGSVVTGDFNGDGYLDFAVATENSVGTTGDVIVYLGKGNGTFQSAKTYKTGEGSEGVATVDLNNDGKLDLAVANYYANNISVLLGIGNGTFDAQKTYKTGSEPNSIASADFNNDGKPDLVVSDYGDQNISVLLGNGDGTFQPATFWNTGGSFNGAIAIADFNGDGNADIAVASGYNFGASVALFLGNGDGTFQPPTYLLTSAPVLALAAADLRNNGLTDLVVSEDPYYVYLSYGDGTFAPPIEAPVANVYNAIAIGDFNGDGLLDIASVGPNGAAGVSLGNGDGTFGPQMLYAVPRKDANINATSLAIGDFNGDGSPDLAVATLGPTGSVNVLLSNPVAVFSANPLNFGKVSVGESSTLSLTVTNQSPTKLTINSVTIAGSAPSDYSQTNSCGAEVAPYGNCTVLVTFKPLAKRRLTAALKFSDSAVGKIRTVSLTGTGN